jgi:hypothetical protein
MNALCCGYSIVHLNITKKRCFCRTYPNSEVSCLYQSPPMGAYLSCIRPPLTLTTLPHAQHNTVFLLPPPSYKWPFSGCFRPIIKSAFPLSPILMTFPALRFRCPNEGRCPVYMSVFFVVLNGWCHLSEA